MQVAEILARLLLKALGISAHQRLKIMQGQICIDRLCYCLESKSCNSVVEYAPIAKALCPLDASTERRLRRNFEITYFLCKENMPFIKMEVICQSEESHGVDLVLKNTGRHVLCLLSI